MTGAASTAFVVAVLLLLERRERNRRHRTASGPWWPWLIGAIERDVRRHGTDLPSATVRAGLGGPPWLRAATRRAVGAADRTDPAAVVGALRDRVGTATGDCVFGTVSAVHQRGAPADAVLAWARADAAAAAMHDADVAAVAAGGTAARWLLLAPIVPWVAGHLPGIAGWAAAATAVALWWAAGRWLRARRDVRVFAAEPIGSRP